jgi:hypothetical protein
MVRRELSAPAVAELEGWMREHAGPRVRAIARGAGSSGRRAQSARRVLRKQRLRRSMGQGQSEADSDKCAEPCAAASKAIRDQAGSHTGVLWNF